MNTKTQLFCAWCGPAYVAVLVIALSYAGILPAHSPTLNPAEVAATFQEDPFRIRLGLMVSMWATMLFILYSAVVSVQMARIEGRSPVLSWAQLAAAAGAALSLELPIMFWEATAFRPDRLVDSTQLLDDLANTLWGGMTVPFILQPLCIAIVGFMDKSKHPTFPRWVCYLNLFTVFILLPGGSTIFFKTGPLAWDGMFALYIPFAEWVVWFGVMTFFLTKAIKRQAATESV